jgi:PAS domain S-box-containing protein
VPRSAGGAATRPPAVTTDFGTADGIGRLPRLIRRHTGWLLTAPLVMAVLLSTAALGGIVALMIHANASRDAQVQLDAVTTMVDGLQDVPWQLASSTDKTPAEVAVDMAATEHGVTRRLSQLEHSFWITQLAGVGSLLGRNFGLLGDERSLLGRHQLAAATRLEPSRFRIQDRVVRALERADSAYHQEAVKSEIEATAGSAVIVLMLLCGFGFFFARALQARRAAEVLTGELRASEAHLEYAQRVAGVGSWEWHTATQTVVCSAEHARLHGWPAEDVTLTPEELLEVVDPDDRQHVLLAITAGLEGGEPVSVEYRVGPSDASRLIHLDATVLRIGDGRSAGLFGTCQDVTDRFQRAEAERANQAKSEFISRMSHELRTPLNAILGFGQLLTGAELEETQHANVERIVDAGRHLLGLINEILDISRIEAGQLRLSPEPVRLADVIDDAIDLVGPLADERRIVIDTDPGAQDDWVKADMQRLKQVLLNLLSNAIKYNHDGGHVMVCTSPAGDRVRIVVSDDGPGIAPDMLDRLFHPFERLGAEQTAVEGTGLGLALCKGMVEAMGGTISVQSSSGEGAAFVVELESAAPRALIAAPATEAHVRDVRVGVAQTVLCIEDNPSNLTLIEQVLSMRPQITLLTAADGARGTELARAHRPELVLLDLNLPDMKGADALARLKTEPDTGDIPVVVLSADATPEQAERLIAAGAAAYVTKPIDVQQFLGAVDDALAQAVGAAA